MPGSSENNLENNGDKLNELYKKLNTYVDNGYQSRQNINLLMNSYYQFDDTDTYNLNLINTNSNVDIDVDQKQNELTTIENNNIRNQYKELENIKYNIINKNSLIENTNSALEETNIKINILSTILFFSFLFLIVIYLYGSNTISSTILLGSFIFILIIYGLLLLYYFDIGAFRLFVYNFYNVKGFKFDQQLKGWVDQMDNNLQEIKSEFATSNCDCPTAENSSNNKNTDINTNNRKRNKSNIIYNENGEEEEYNSQYRTIQSTDYSYYDDSAPPQTVYPFPNSSMKNEIEWVDYDIINNSGLPNSALSNDITYTKNM